MKVVLLTNIASHHQMDFARAMAKLLGVDNFRAVFLKTVPEERLVMRWSDDDDFNEPFIIRFWESDKTKMEALRWIDQADVVIQGAFPIRYVRERIKQGKLTFAKQERFWKKPPTIRRRITRLPRLYKNYYSVANRENYHFLAIGARAAQDLNGLGIFQGRSWKFGYFMDTPEYRVKQHRGDSVSLLWCASFIPLKQPRQALTIACGLRQRGMEVLMTMIGDGELRPSIEQLIRQSGMDSYVTLTGWQNQDEVRRRMLDSDLFLMTSNRGEGWGMVVNEALGCGCCVMANRESGAAPWLVEHGKSGFLYDDETLNGALDEIVTTDRDRLLDMGRLGHQRMMNEWSAQVAAGRVIDLSAKLLDGDTESARRLFRDGPCSVA